MNHDREKEQRSRRWLARRAELSCAALLLAMAANLFSVIPTKSVTNDELYHIPAGYYHLTAGYSGIDVEHAPLAMMWAALPLLWMPLDVSSRMKGEEAAVEDLPWHYVSRFWLDNHEHFLGIVHWTRSFLILVTIALGGLIFTTARQLFGPRAALFAVALFVIEPTVLAHGRIVDDDVASALAYLLSFVTLHGYLRDRGCRRAAVVGMASGVALATKLSMVVLLPVLVCVALHSIVFAPRLGERRSRIGLHAGVAVISLLFVVNAAYYFRSTPLRRSDADLVRREWATHGNEMVTALRVGSKVLPTDFLLSAYAVAAHDRRGHPASLLGRHSLRGWRWYFPVAVALKTTLPFLIAAAASVCWGVWRLAAERDARFLLLLAPVAAYFAMAAASHVNIGVRHVLPVFPFLFITTGSLLDRLLRVRRRAVLAIASVVVTLGWATAEAVKTYPDYLPYMNQLACEHPRWWYLSDSNVEWGEDLQALAAYLHAKGEDSVRGALSAGWALTLYGVTYHEIPPKLGVSLPETRYIAIGAAFLNGSIVDVPLDHEGRSVAEEERVNYFAEYRDRQPEAVFGGTVYLYRVSGRLGIGRSGST